MIGMIDLSELAREIERASPKHGPGRLVHLDREYAKALLAALTEHRRAPPRSRRRGRNSHES